MAIYVAIRASWSMTWLSMIHNDVDLTDPESLDVLYEMTGEYLCLVHRILDDEKRPLCPDTLPHLTSELLYGRGVVDIPYWKFTNPWWELYTELKYVLNRLHPFCGIPEAVIDYNGALVGFVFDVPS